MKNVKNLLTLAVLGVSGTYALAEGPQLEGMTLVSAQANNVMSIALMSSSADTNMGSIQSGSSSGMLLVSADSNNVMSIALMDSKACTNVGVIGQSDNCGDALGDLVNAVLK